jgi:hypothetical protein
MISLLKAIIDNKFQLNHRSATTLEIQPSIKDVVHECEQKNQRQC